MANKKNLVGMLVMVLAFGLTLMGCDNGTNGENNESDSGTGATPTEFEFTSSQVSIRTADTNNFPWWFSDKPANEGFSVEVNGETANIVGVFTANGPKVYIDVADSGGNDYGFTSKHVVTVSYNGTGYFTGKLKPFTNKAAKYK